VLVVQHTHPTSPKLLADILCRAGDIKVSYAEDGQPMELGHVYLAPADRHLLVEPGRMRVVHGPKENLSRPAIDPLFRSAAVHYGPRAIGVILTGSLNDGTSGLAALKECGGISVVQSPEDAHAPEMPASAIRHVAVDHCVPLSEIAPLLVRLVNTPIHPERAAVPEEIKLESEVAAMRADGMSANDKLGTRSTLTCPDCGGVLWEMQDERPIRFRCHVGHSMTAEVLVTQQNEAVERALWLAVKTLEESGALAVRLASAAKEQGDTFSADLFAARAQKAGEQAATLREILIKTAGL
jgi:two-component system chemotaxis response regulator CheB